MVIREALLTLKLNIQKKNNARLLLFLCVCRGRQCLKWSNLVEVDLFISSRCSILIISSLSDPPCGFRGQLYSQREGLGANYWPETLVIPAPFIPMKGRNACHTFLLCMTFPSPACLQNDIQICTTRRNMAYRG